MCFYAKVFVCDFFLFAVAFLLYPNMNFKNMSGGIKITWNMHDEGAVFTGGVVCTEIKTANI